MGHEHDVAHKRRMTHQVETCSKGDLTDVKAETHLPPTAQLMDFRTRHVPYLNNVFVTCSTNNMDEGRRDASDGTLADPNHLHGTKMANDVNDQHVLVVQATNVLTP